jgi:hypothetical protein
MNRRVVGTFVGAMVVGAFAGSTEEAKAFHVVQHAAACYNDTSISSIRSSMRDQDFGIKWTYSGVPSANIICPVPGSHDAVPAFASSIAHLGVVVASAPVFANACQGNTFGGSSCRPTRSSVGTGAQQISLVADRSVWQMDFGYSYIFVNVGLNAVVRGLMLCDNPSCI